MSYSICRISKIKASGVTGIQIHDRREKEGVSHSNEDIDWSRTKENVNLLEQKERFRTAVSNRINELHLTKAVRKDATVMSQCLITSDSAFFDKMSRSEQLEFFRKSFDFIQDRYGKENMISATVHFDEKTPHLHVNFVPVTSDQRLSAKDLFSPASLRTLQDDFNRACKEGGYALERGELHSQKEHLAVEEYKVATRYDDLKAKQIEIDRLEAINKTVHLEAEKGKLTYSTKEVEAIKDQNRALKLETHQKSDSLNRLGREFSSVQNALKSSQRELETVKGSMVKLNDLEDEKRFIAKAMSLKPEHKEYFSKIERTLDNAHKTGNDLITLKAHYQRLTDSRKECIDKTYSFESRIKECDLKISQAKDSYRKIDVTEKELKQLNDKLPEVQGIFKSGQRKELQTSISQKESQFQEELRSFEKVYGYHVKDFNQLIGRLELQKTDLKEKKLEQIKETDNCESAMNHTIKDFKYIKAVGMCQSEPLYKIITRKEESLKLPGTLERDLKITRDDKPWIMERMGKELPALCQKFDKLTEVKPKEITKALPKLDRSGPER